MNYRRHGCQLPLHVFQILTWILEVLSIAEVIFVLAEQFKFEIKALVYIIETGTFLAVAFLGLWVTFIHPQADSIKLSRAAEQEKRSLSVQDYPQWCNICRASVVKATKHCTSCNRCVEGFDHHCNWVNNCIGSKNYQQFFILLLTAQFRYLFHIAFHLYGTVLIFQNQVVPIFDSQQFTIASILIITIVSIIESISVFVLLIFHLYFYTNSMTTFQWIQLRRSFQTVGVENQDEATPKDNQTINQSVVFNK